MGVKGTVSLLPIKLSSFYFFKTKDSLHGIEAISKVLTFPPQITIDMLNALTQAATET